MNSEQKYEQHRHTFDAFEVNGNVFVLTRFVQHNDYYKYQMENGKCSKVNVLRVDFNFVCTDPHDTQDIGIVTAMQTPKRTAQI